MFYVVVRYESAYSVHSSQWQRAGGTLGVLWSRDSTTQATTIGDLTTSLKSASLRASVAITSGILARTSQACLASLPCAHCMWPWSRPPPVFHTGMLHAWRMLHKCSTSCDPLILTLRLSAIKLPFWRVSRMPARASLCAAPDIVSCQHRDEALACEPFFRTFVSLAIAHGNQPSMSTQTLPPPSPKMTPSLLQPFYTWKQARTNLVVWVALCCLFLPRKHPNSCA